MNPYRESDEYKRIAKKVKDLFEEIDLLLDELESKFPTGDHQGWGIDGDNSPQVFVTDQGD